MSYKQHLRYKVNCQIEVFIHNVRKKCYTKLTFLSKNIQADCIDFNMYLRVFHIQLKLLTKYTETINSVMRCETDEPFNNSLLTIPK